MKLTTKGRYAVAAMMDLALHEKGKAVGLQAIAQRQNIPISYLGKLFVQLRERELVVSQRGPGGGYILTKHPDEIMLADVIDAVDETLDTTRCGGKADCQNHQQCLTHRVWDKLSKNIRLFLSEMSLTDAIKEQDVVVVAKRQDREYQEYKQNIMGIEHIEQQVVGTTF